MGTRIAEVHDLPGGAAVRYRRLTAGEWVAVARRQARARVVRAMAIVAVVVVMLLALPVSFSAGHWSAADGKLPPCATEDSSNCFWDATERGNRAGQSFVDIDGVAYYSEPAR